MARSKLAKDLDSLQSCVRAMLEPRGFRVRGRTFNRVNDDGLTEVLDLQMGAFDPPGTVEIPGLRESTYGYFTVNLGIHVPEVEKHDRNARRRSDFLREYDCCIRTRLGGLAGEGDLWWRIEPDSLLLEEIWTRIERDGFPFFARFASRDRILREFLATEEREFIGGPPPLIICAFILFERGQRDGARDCLLAQARGASDHSRHVEYLRELSTSLGLGPLEL
jgi:hypothetical protein